MLAQPYLNTQPGPSNYSRGPPTPTSPAPHGLVQAIHDFEPAMVPTPLPDDGHTYLHFTAGEIIRVHRKAHTGWWDGEIVSDREDVRGPRRGWFPNNYARKIKTQQNSHVRSQSVQSVQSHTSHIRQTSTTSHRSQTSMNSSTIHVSPAKRPLSSEFQLMLEPNYRAVALLEESINSQKRAHLQPSTGYIISEVRLTLLQLDSLNRDSPSLRTYPVLGNARKHVLVELSKLVSTARTASERIQGEGTPEDTNDFEAILRAARAVLVNLQKFLVLAAEIGLKPAPREKLKQEEMLASPPSISDTITQNKIDAEGQLSGQDRMREAFQRRAKSIGDLRQTKKMEPEQPPLPTASLKSTNSSGPRSPSAATPISATFSVASGRTSQMSSRSLSRTQGSIDSGSIASSDGMGPSEDITPVPTPPISTMMVVPQRRDFASVADVLDAIGVAEEALLSIIAAFIGHIHSHHLGSHPSSHANLIEMTRETVDSVRQLLTIVEAVGRNTAIRLNRPREIESLRISKDNLYDIASRLVEGAEAVANAPFEEAGEELYDAEKARLLQCATGTLRAGTECVRLVRGCLPEDETTAIPSNTPKLDFRQNSPRPLQAAAVVARPKPVGARGVHTLSGLHRKANSLSQLRARFQVKGVMEEKSFEDVYDEPEEEDEEFVQDSEDLTVRPMERIISGRAEAITSVSLHPEDLSGKRPDMMKSFSDTGPPPSRSRSSSLSSPMPPRLQRRSPSRSVDLDKFTNDYDIPIRKLSPVSRGSIGTMQSMTSADTTLSVSTGAAPQTPHDESFDLPDDADDKTEENIDTSLGSMTVDDRTPVRRPSVGRSMTASFAIPTINNDQQPDIRFWVVSHDYDPREIAFNSDGAIIGASLQVLVEKMTPHDGPADPTFFTTFFYTFRIFTSPQTLLDALLTRYEVPPPPGMYLGDRERAIWLEKKVVPVRFRIFNLLKLWLETHWRSEDVSILEPLKNFANERVTRTLPAMAPRLLDSINRRMTNPSSSKLKRQSSMDLIRMKNSPITSAPNSALPPTPIISKSLHSLLQKASTQGTSLNKVPITEFDTLELARQLTIMESRLFCFVAPEDLLQTAGGKGRKSKSVKELKDLSTMSNQITGWVADNILDEMDAKKRASLLKFYIKLADKCLTLQNFSTMFAVLAGLNSSTILRLKKTWDALPAKYRLMMERLRGVIEHTKNHQAYRARLRDAVGPCLPFLGLILTDITFTSEGNPDTRPSVLEPDLTLINHDKYAKLGKIAIDFKRYQEPFNFHELPAVQTFLRRVLAERGSSSLDALYRKSCEFSSSQPRPR
ncbi:hypothetical protein TREMEDRAFT_25574 [Tremella mesenterica DSM 1558]|uniref:uncharacterized protein n=1 Tax=Tremella mesenterica (strain ATCC 24925 / CBS 8224 / DSM 1558 / NBRC 9311 / NRRL Y-6157 / RJB 2259-6 / UBC 559-6) TaxID=578456 RepID=UPI0003F4A52E|nr:uncharacterized protein TREMEDRAFT_25574 [Tremella mesenterica DSM 1558]EIW72489.1 hypothetical protein TREMEDRAFT_25574 [Tremella mesenterica DSM 1558]